MQIKINGKTVSAEILPMDKPTLDETLESFSFSLISNTNPIPYAPCQKVQVITDGNETINLIVVSDSVEPFSMNPQRFKHNITCVQNTRLLSKHLVRNSSFTTPSYLEKKSNSTVCFALGRRNYVDSDYTTTWGTYALHSKTTPIVDPVELTFMHDGQSASGIPEKVKAAYFEMEFQGILCSQVPDTTGDGVYGNSQWVYPKSIAEVYDACQGSTTSLVFENVWLYAQIDNETPYGEQIDPHQFGDSGWYPLNQKIRLKRVEELAAQGYKKFWIQWNPGMVSGYVRVYYGNYWMMFFLNGKITLETYYYDCYDILKLLRLRQQKARNEGGVSVQESPLFELPASGDLYNLLKSTPAPNFTFTQSTMYECVAQVFSLFDAIFTMDTNGVLGIEYFNEENGTDITSTFVKVGQNSASSEDKYTSGLVTFYQDARTKEAFPAGINDLSSFSTPRTKDLGVPDSDRQFIFEVPHSIESITNCFFKSDNVDGQEIKLLTDWTYQDLDPNNPVYLGIPTLPLWGYPVLDIGHWVVDEELWTYLNPTNQWLYKTDPLLQQQINTLFFPRGQKYIDISYSYKRTWWGTNEWALTFAVNAALQLLSSDKNYSDNDRILYTNVTSKSWNQLKFKLIYYTSVDGRLKIESTERKYDGETLIDQYNGAVDLNKMGLNILGLSLKYGNPTLTATQKITTWANRVKVGDIYYYPDTTKKWIANVVNYTIMPGGYVQATIQFSQNFNALSMRTQLLRVKRMSNISSELTMKSEENIIDFVYFSITSTNDGAWATTRTPIAFNLWQLAFDLAASLGQTEFNSTPITSYVYGLEVATVDSSFQGGNERKYVPMIKYGAGNSLCFEMSYDDPKSAGKQTKASASGAWYFDNPVKYFTKIIPYATEVNETLPVVDIAIFPQNTTTSDDNFPIITPSISPLFEITWLQYLKQPNEIFAINYQMTFLPTNKTKEFVGSQFINDNFLVNSNLRTLADIMVCYQTGTFKYSNLDTKGEGNTVNVDNVTLLAVNETEHVILIEFTLRSSVTATSFAICDKDKNILFAANKNINGNKIYLTFTTATTRSDNKVLEDY